VVAEGEPLHVGEQLLAHRQDDPLADERRTLAAMFQTEGVTSVERIVDELSASLEPS
jgi:hypothetical protein